VPCSRCVILEPQVVLHRVVYSVSLSPVCPASSLLLLVLLLRADQLHQRNSFLEHMLNSTPTTTQSQRLHKFRKSRRNTLSTASTEMTGYESDHLPTMSRHQCCGIVEEAALRAREKRQNRTIPQPWVVRKIAVFLTLGIMGYSGYVYISRFCISSIKRTRQSTTGRPTASECSFPWNHENRSETWCCSCSTCCFLYFIFVDDLGVFQGPLTFVFLSQARWINISRWFSRRQVMLEMYVWVLDNFWRAKSSIACASMSSTAPRTTR